MDSGTLQESKRRKVNMWEQQERSSLQKEGMWMADSYRNEFTDALGGR